MKVTMRVNGSNETYDSEPGETLLTTLRTRAGASGVKQGCDFGGCGACTVIVDGLTVYSCMTLTLKLEGSDVTTVEGLESQGRLSRLQEDFVKEWALQCGYCTPGMLLSTRSLLDKVQSPTKEQMREALAGNICRCTGYVQIFEAIETAALEERLARASPGKEL